MKSVYHLHLNIKENQVYGWIVFLDQLHTVIVRGNLYVPACFLAVLVQ